ncbi:hypothetical protein BLNAU_22688 [Blattamonas nauphoetae]|uniref:Uncharacterized protein n=1 Tax=Blattamonas nauphoetae TaxID=2049346 RepID=A0ABQ9WWJ0_9EUKA|nr:hypothetical protein BLNAU_22688 [Blattamonas nauphoetae]
MLSVDDDCFGISVDKRFQKEIDWDARIQTKEDACCHGLICHLYPGYSPFSLFHHITSISDWRLVNVFGHAASAYDEDLKTLVETAFRAAGGIVAHRFVTCSVVDQSWIDTYIFAVITSGAPFGGAPMTGCSHGDTGRAEPSLGIIDDSHHFSVIGASTISTLTQDCACLHWMIPNKNTFDDDCVVGQLKTSKGDNMCNITLKNWTWTYDQAGKAGVKTAIQRTRSITDQPLVQPKVMTHVMYSIGVNTTAGVILNATNPRWWSDAHSDYYMDDDGTVSNVSLSVLHKWRDPSLV